MAKHPVPLGRLSGRQDRGVKCCEKCRRLEVSKRGKVSCEKGHALDAQKCGEFSDASTEHTMTGGLLGVRLWVGRV